MINGEEQKNTADERESLDKDQVLVGLGHGRALQLDGGERQAADEKAVNNGRCLVPWRRRRRRRWRLRLGATSAAISHLGLGEGVVGLLAGARDQRFEAPGLRARWSLRRVSEVGVLVLANEQASKLSHHICSLFSGIFNRLQAKPLCTRCS